MTLHRRHILKGLAGAGVGLATFPAPYVHAQTAFKIGLLGSLEQVAAIAEVVSDYPDVPLVLDPVLSSGRGDELVPEEMLHALKELLIPQSTIITPNSLEARRIAVEKRHWISDREFADIVSLCQFMPGPNIVGIAVCVGAKMRGTIGTLAAIAGGTAPYSK